MVKERCHPSGRDGGGYVYYNVLCLITSTARADLGLIEHRKGLG